jgi:type IV secretion system protein VirB1
MILTALGFALLASQCGPQVHIDTLAAVAQAESGRNTLAIRDNTTGRSYHPKSEAEAIELATRLVMVDHHSVDMGLMQINSTHLRPFLTISDAFDACKNIRAGAQILASDYKPGADDDQQAALDKALSRYNTGSPERGVANGYVQRVKVAAQQVVPAIRIDSDVSSGRDSTQKSVVVHKSSAIAARADDQQRDGDRSTSSPTAPSESPPAWDVFGQARFQRRRGEMVFGGQRQGASALSGQRKEDSSSIAEVRPVGAVARQ